MPSLAVMIIPEVTETAAVPVNAPVVVLKPAQVGLLVMLNVTGNDESEPLILGVNEYVRVSSVSVTGVPVIARLEEFGTMLMVTSATLDVSPFWSSMV